MPNDLDCGVKRSLAYAAYNLYPVALCCGIVRAATAAVYIFKHFLNNRAIQKALEAKRDQNDKKILESTIKYTREVSTAKRKGGVFRVFKAKAKQKLGDIKNDLAAEWNDTKYVVNAEAAKAKEQKGLDSWKGDLGRGLLVMIPGVSIYYTYKDNWGKNKGFSILRLGEIDDRIDKEDAFAFKIT